MGPRVSGASSSLEASQSWPAAGAAPPFPGARTSVRSPFEGGLPPMMSAELRMTSHNARGEEASGFASASSGAFGAASSSSSRPSPRGSLTQPPLRASTYVDATPSPVHSPTAAAGSPGAAEGGFDQRRPEPPLQAHALSFKSRGSSVSSQGALRSRLGSLTEGPEEAGSSAASANGENHSGLTASSSAASGLGQQGSQQGFMLPGQMPGANAGSAGSMVAQPADSRTAQENGHARSAGEAVRAAGSGTGTDVPGVVEKEATVPASGYRTATTGVVMAPEGGGLEAVLSGKSHATDPGALRELLELDP